MSVEFEINAKLRSDMGKGASRRLRREGLLPGIIYGAHKDPTMISLLHNELIRHLEHESFYSHVLTMKIDGKAEQVVLKDLQRHPAKPFVLHADFLRISADEVIRMHVPLHFVNESTAPGVKMGGAVSHNITDVEISCLPKDLPEFIEIDLGAMDVGDTVHLSEIKMPNGVSLAHAPDPDLPVVTIHSGHGGAEDEAEGGAAPA